MDINKFLGLFVLFGMVLGVFLSSRLGKKKWNVAISIPAQKIGIRSSLSAIMGGFLLLFGARLTATFDIGTWIPSVSGAVLY